MWFSVLLGLSTLALAWSIPYSSFDQIIKEVNAANTTWKAGHNFNRNTPWEYIYKLAGAWLDVPIDDTLMPIRTVTYSGTPIPDEFDARKQWPECPTISHILDQSHCGSCWAVSVASVLSDRLCIKSNGNFTLPMSGEDLMSCSIENGGCHGGHPFDAWLWIRENGLVTGGDYGSGVGCQPYDLPPCEHHITGPRPPCSEIPEKSPACKKKCTNAAYPLNYEQDLHYVTELERFRDIAAIQENIMKHGPVDAGFHVHADFPHYKSGVYQTVPGSQILAGHAVRIIGWGTEKGTPYWLIANSWNSDWGDHGTFKILRGANECGIESYVSAGALKSRV